MITKKKLELYRELANKLNSQVQNSNESPYQVTVKDYPNLVDELLGRLEECVYKEENAMEELDDILESGAEAWKGYLIKIGVTDLTNEDEISQKLEEIELRHPDYEKSLIEALGEINFEESSFTPNNDMKAWLLSLGDNW